VWCEINYVVTVLSPRRPTPHGEACHAFAALDRTLRCALGNQISRELAARRNKAVAAYAAALCEPVARAAWTAFVQALSDFLEPWTPASGSPSTAQPASRVANCAISSPRTTTSSRRGDPSAEFPSSCTVSHHPEVNKMERVLAFIVTAAGKNSIAKSIVLALTLVGSTAILGASPVMTPFFT
jgi:hypothetical protein